MGQTTWKECGVLFAVVKDKLLEKSVVYVLQ